MIDVSIIIELFTINILVIVIKNRVNKIFPFIQTKQMKMVCKGFETLYKNRYDYKIVFIYQLIKIQSYNK